jgi:hypothetical protein
MKAIIAALTAVSVLAGAAVPVSAQAVYSEGYEVKQSYSKKKRKKRYRRARVHSGGEVYYRGSGRIQQQPQYWADKLPTGTPDWWRQMDREGRGGRRQ